MWSGRTFWFALRGLLCGLAWYALPGDKGSAGIAAARERLIVVAGGGTRESGPATECRLDTPFGVEFDPQGRMVIVELTGQRVLRVDKEGLLTRVAGNGQKGNAGDGGPAGEATFNGLHNLALGREGTIYLADTWNHKVRRILPLEKGAAAERIDTLAGTGQKGFAGDGGPAISASFGGIYCVALDPAQRNLYLADLDNRRIRRIELATGVVTTVAGNGKAGVPADGSVATESPLADPRAVAVDERGQVYVLERGGHALRVVDTAGKIKTVVGTGKGGVSGDGGPGNSAQLNGPKHLILDRDGSVLIADTENHVIRRYDPVKGVISRVAGTGKKGSSGAGSSPLEVELNQPHGVYVHPEGDLFIVDSWNHRVLKRVKD